jgi:phosphoglycolate phosphatase
MVFCMRKSLCRNGVTKKHAGHDQEVKDEMVKVCIFDLDGTLTDTLESIARPLNLMLEHFGLKPHPVEKYNYYAGDGLLESVRRALSAAGDTKESHVEEGTVLAGRWLQEDPLYHVKPYPHIVEVLKELKRRGIRLAVFSNKPHEAAVDVVGTIFGKELFDRVQGQTAEIPRKPDPTGALAIMKRFGVSPEECLYFGDTNTDMQTGHGAGIFTVGVTWGFRPRKELEENHADRIIDSPLEILDFPETVPQTACGGEDRS